MTDTDASPQVGPESVPYPSSEIPSLAAERPSRFPAKLMSSQSEVAYTIATEMPPSVETDSVPLRGRRDSVLSGRAAESVPPVPLPEHAGCQGVSRSMAAVPGTLVFAVVQVLAGVGGPGQSCPP